MTAELPELLKITAQAGVEFRLAGRSLRVTSPPDASEELCAALDTLKAHKAEVWALLKGAEKDRPSLELLAQLGVEPVVPRTLDEARELIAEMEADSDEHTPEAVLRSRGGLLGLDIETAALEGQEIRPPVKLRLRDGLPAVSQHALPKDGAGLDPHRSTIRLVQIYGGGQRCLVLDTRLVPIEVLAGVLSRRVMVIHNASMELRFLPEAGIEVPKFEDTMQAAGLLLGAYRRGADDAASAYLGIDLPKGLQRSDWGANTLSPGQVAYAALDAIVAFRLWLKMRIELQEKQRGKAYIIQRDVTPATVRMSRRGIGIDLAAHQRVWAEWQADQDAAVLAFVTEMQEKPPSTPAEIRSFLPKVLPPEVIEGWPRTGKQSLLSVAGAELKRHVALPAIRDLITINAKAKLLSSFGVSLRSKVSAKSGRLHPTYNIASTKTGRFSSSNPNIQQIPKHKAKGMRECFVADDGKVLVIADYSMMELRAAAELYDDAAMRADFAAGVDLHRRQAAETQGKSYDDVTSQERDAAKPTCFGVIYGAGPWGLVASAWANYGLVKSEQEAASERHAFLTRYSAVSAGMERNWIRFNRLGHIDIEYSGRVIEAAWERQEQEQQRSYIGEEFFEADDEDDAGDEQAAQQRYYPPRNYYVLKRTLCCNAPVQGSCADVSMIALTKADVALTAAGIAGGPVLFVHDEIVLEVAEADAERAGELLRAAMVEAFAEVFPHAPLTGLVELKIRREW
jgi:DNA polymerase I-like protein with 3'-5' exonuclease and polymerase domains